MYFGPWDTAVVAIVVIGGGALLTEIPQKLVTYWWIFISSVRMDLRDKGKSEDEMVCDFCETPTRVGIDTKKEAHIYCWRCETILDEDDPDPKDREDLPADESAKDGSVEVVDLSMHRRRKKVA